MEPKFSMESNRPVDPTYERWEPKIDSEEMAVDTDGSVPESEQTLKQIPEINEPSSSEELPAVPKETVIKNVLDAELEASQLEPKKQGIWEKIKDKGTKFFSKSTADSCVKALGVTGKLATDAYKNVKEHITGTKKEVEQKKEITAGQGIKDFLTSEIDRINKKTEESPFQNAIRGAMKNAPAKILIGAALGSLGPLGSVAKAGISVFGGGLMGQGIAESHLESKILQKLSKVEGLRDQKTGEYHSEKLSEELSKLSEAELSQIVGGLSRIATGKGLHIAKEIAELSTGIKHNEKNSWIQGLYDKIPYKTKGLVKALPIILGGSMLAAPLLLPISVFALAAMSAGAAVVGMGIDRAAHGPKSIGKYYNHSLVVAGAVDELEKKFAGKSDSERLEIVNSVHEADSEVTSKRLQGTVLGMAGMGAFQFAAPHAVHGMSRAFHHVSSFFANGGLPPTEHTNLLPTSAEFKDIPQPSHVEPLANTAEFKDIPPAQAEVNTLPLHEAGVGQMFGGQFDLNHAGMPSLEAANIEAPPSHEGEMGSMFGGQFDLTHGDTPNTGHAELLASTPEVHPLPLHESEVGQMFDGQFDLHDNVVLPVQHEHGLHLMPLGDNKVLHWEGAATAEHPSSAVNSLAHEVVGFSGANESLSAHDKNEIAHKLAADWIHRGLFHTDGSLVQHGKENLVDKINALSEFHQAAQHIGSSVASTEHVVTPHTENHISHVEKSDTIQSKSETHAPLVKHASVLHTPAKTMATPFVEPPKIETPQSVVNPGIVSEIPNPHQFELPKLSSDAQALPGYVEGAHTAIVQEPISHIDKVVQEPSVLAHPVSEPIHQQPLNPEIQNTTPNVEHQALENLKSNLSNLTTNELRSQELGLSGKEADQWGKIDSSVYGYAEHHKQDKDLFEQFLEMIGNGGAPKLPQEMSGIAPLMSDAGNADHFTHAVKAAETWSSGE